MDHRGILQDALRAHRAGELDRAEAGYRHVLALAPDRADVLQFLGALCLQRHDFATAEGFLRQAVEREPSVAAAHNNLAAALRAQGRLEAAAACYRHAIVSDPENRHAHANLGAVLQSLGRHDEAAACLTRALALGGPADGPDTATIRCNLGVALADQGQLDQAIECYRRALAERPNYAAAADNLLYALNHHPALASADIAAAHLAWGDTFRASIDNAAPRFANAAVAERRLNIGYVSADFRTHSIASFLLPLLAAHDRERVAVFCYANSRRADNVTTRYKRLADHWRDIDELPDADAAALIRRDGIDLLVDLAGHTAGNRLALFARKAAPVQLTWLGYPATTGLAAIDYRITDAVADPPGDSERQHSERLLRLDPCFLCFEPPQGAPAVAPLPAVRSGAITFGSFNSARKLTPRTAALWAIVLAAVPGARLLLKARQFGDPATRDRFRALLTAQGIASDRLDLLGATATAELHLAQYGNVDIGLDPFPYNGTTTTCEALWMGVPVITLQGDRHAGRVGASLVSAIGLGELVAASEDDYVARAVALARDEDRLIALRTSLRARVAGSALGDGASFARRIEAAYRAVWRDWCGRTGA